MPKLPFRAALPAICLALSVPAYADTMISGPLANPDAAEVSAIAKATIESLKAGKSSAALDAFFGKSELMRAKVSELKLLAGQIDSLFGVYGPITACQLVDEEIGGSLVSNRLYLCQHANYVTRWKLLTLKTPSSWIGANLSYDDKVQFGLRE